MKTRRFPSRVMKKGKTSENRSDSEAKKPTSLTPNRVLQHPVRRRGAIGGYAVGVLFPVNGTYQEH